MMKTLPGDVVSGMQKLDGVHGILRDSNGNTLNAADLLKLCNSYNVPAADLDFLAMNLENVASARQLAIDAGQEEDYNLLGIEVTFDAGTYHMVLIMRSSGG